MLGGRDLDARNVTESSPVINLLEDEDGLGINIDANLLAGGDNRERPRNRLRALGRIKMALPITILLFSFLKFSPPSATSAARASSIGVLLSVIGTGAGILPLPPWCRLVDRLLS